MDSGPDNGDVGGLKVMAIQHPEELGESGKFATVVRLTEIRIGSYCRGLHGRDCGVLGTWSSWRAWDEVGGRRDGRELWWDTVLPGIRARSARACDLVNWSGLIHA